MILELSQNFICLSYANVDFLIQKSVVETAFFCTEQDFFIDDKNSKKIRFVNSTLPCIDFDVCAAAMNLSVNDVNTKNCIVLNTSSVIKGEQKIALVTSADCRVKNIKLKKFSLFSELFNPILGKKGILACNFNPDKTISYLLDIEIFLKVLELKK